MSFSSNVKAELCREIPAKKCCALAQCYGILLYCNTFSADFIKIVTESQELAALLPRLFKRAFGFGFDAVRSVSTGTKQTFLIDNAEKLEEILDIFGFSMDSVTLHVNLGVLEEDCCKAAFLRGAFLAGGSVTDPSKGYHMELTTTHQCVGREVYSLVQEIMGFYPKTTDRSGSVVLYLKQSGAIEDFLTKIGASVSAMGIMEAKVEKELKNRVNRRCNCDDANISKVVEAAQLQLAAIHRLRENVGLESLPKKLFAAAKARLDNPEANLTELAAMMEPPITKSAMNHRLQRLIELAEE